MFLQNSLPAISFWKHLIIFFGFIMLSAALKSIFLDKLILAYLSFLLALKGRKEEYILNPYYLFLFTPISLLVYYNIGGYYMLNLTHETYFFALVNVGAFTFSLALLNTYRLSRSNFILATSQNSNFLHLLILFTLGYGSRYVPQISGVLWVCMIPVIVIVFKMKSRVLIAVLLAFLLYTLFDHASKTAVLMNILAIFVALEKYPYNGLKNRKKKFKRFALLGFVVVLLSFTYANKNRGTLHADASMEYYSNQGINWSFPSEIFMPYMYSTSPWANLQYVLETQTTHTWGLWTLKPFLGYLFLDNLFEEYYQLAAYSSFNTFTYMVCAFKDFGYAGSFFMSIFLGYFVKYVYLNFKLSESPFDVAIYACSCLAVVEMFFSNHFFMQSYPFTIIIVLGLYQIIVRSIVR